MGQHCLHRLCYQYRRELVSKSYREECAIDDCIRLSMAHSDLCSTCKRRIGRGGSKELPPTNNFWHRDMNGYIVLSPSHPLNKTDRPVYAHRAYMEQIIGRKLLSHESVHHKDGDRANNVASNLELWSSSQPPGQRIEDKVIWAKEILRLYG